METKTFAELGLSAKVMAAVDASGYTIPTPIQAGAIPMAVEGRDVLGIAQTGTGKTAAFVLPLLSRLERGRARARMPRSLILAPTRELAAQVSEAFETYGTNQKVSMALLIGGVSFTEQLKKLDRGVDVLIATPGRLLDHHGRGKLLLTGVEFLVIDEADRMLDMGFIPDIEKICKFLPPRRQTLFFSATMPTEITRLAAQFLKDPVRVEVAPPATAAKTITQRFRFLPDGTDWVKRDVLREMIRGESELQNAIVFCNRKRDVAILLKSLQKHGFNAGALHGDMDQSSRMATLAAFRTGEITILAASDVAARGLDIPAVSHVFNYDMPWQSDDYVHRIGRTGRAGRKGYAASLVTADDLKVVKDLEKAGGEPIEWIGEPPGDNVESTRRGRGGRGGRGGREDRNAGGRGSRPTGRGARSGSGGGGESVTSSADRPRRGGRGRGRKQDAQSTPTLADNAATSPISAAQPATTPREKGAVEQVAAEQAARDVVANEQVAGGRAAGDTASSRGRRSRRRGGARRDTAKPEQGADQAEASTDAADRQPRPAEQRARGGAKRSSDTNKTKRAAKGNGDTRARSSVEGAPSGLADNVPAFLKRPPRVS